MKSTVLPKLLYLAAAVLLLFCLICCGGNGAGKNVPTDTPTDSTDDTTIPETELVTEPATEPVLTAADMVGDWYIADVSYFGLFMQWFTFNENGTFTSDSMGFMQIDVDTGFYAYGEYWDGASGATYFEGEYTVKDGVLTIKYHFSDPEMEDYVNRVEVYTTKFYGDSFEMTKDGITSLVQKGNNPPEDSVMPEVVRVMHGTWYTCGEPVTNQNGVRELSVDILMFADGSRLQCERYKLFYENGTWNFPEASTSLAGGYTYKDGRLKLHYTEEHDYSRPTDDFDYTIIPVEMTCTFTLTTKNDVVTAFSCSDPSVYQFAKISKAYYEIIDEEQFLGQMNDMFP